MADDRFVRIFRRLCRAFDNGEAIHLLGLTSDPIHPLHYDDLRRRAFRSLKQDLGRSTRSRRAYRLGAYQSALGFDPATHRLHLHLVTVGGDFIPQSVLWTLASNAGFGSDVDIAGVPSEKARKKVKEGFVATGFLAGYRQAEAHDRASKELADVAAYMTHGENNGLDLALTYAKSAASHFQPFTSSGWSA